MVNLNKIFLLKIKRLAEKVFPSDVKKKTAVFDFQDDQNGVSDPKRK